MPIDLPLDSRAHARTLLRLILTDGDVLGRDDTGRTVIALAVNDWTLDQLLAFDAAADELEDADGEPEPDEEPDCPPVLALDVRRPKRLYGRSESRHTTV